MRPRGRAPSVVFHRLEGPAGGAGKVNRGEDGLAEQRSAQEVLDDHLATSLNGTVDDDLGRNYARDVAVVSNWGASSAGTTGSAR